MQMCSRGASRPGFSLVEVVVVIMVMAVLISFAMPTFGVAIEQAHADIAATNLRAIWTAERLYWLENRTYTTDLSALQSAGLLDSAIVTGSSQYAYAVSAADASTFSATATRMASQRWSGSFTIDQTGTVSGSLQAAGQTAIVPGFE